MKAIKQLVEHIREQLQDAQDYSRSALQYKDTDSKLGMVYHDLAKEQISHADMLHDNAIRIIKEYRQTGVKIPESMQAVWEWEHDQIIEDKSDILMLMEMY